MAITTIVLVIGVSFSNAQNNPYKIDDRIYPVYMKAYENRVSEQGLALSDSVYNMAVKLGDKKAECLAKTIPMLYYYYNDSDDKFENALKELQDLSLKNGYPQYFYHGVSHKTNRYLTEEKTYSALMYIQKIQEFAKSNHHTYGIYSTMRELAKIHEKRGEYRTAIEEYEKALEYGKKNLPGQEMASNYRKIARCYMKLREFNKQLEYTDNGLEEADTKQAKDMLLQIKAHALFMLGRTAEFCEIYDNLKLDSVTVIKTQVLIMKELYFMKLIADNNWNEAEMFLSKNVHTAIDKLRMQIILYEKKGEYYNAYYALIKKNQIQDSLNQDILTRDMLEISIQLDNSMKEVERQKLARQNTNLQLENTKLILQNSELELGRSKATANMAKLDAENMQLKLDNSLLEANQLRDSLDIQNAAQRARDQEMRNNKIIFTTIVIIIVIMLISTGCYIYYRSKMSKRLKKTNEELNMNVIELEKARDEAQQADKMKTMFIQNMSHEIRTPLNAIVGFSQLLSDMGDALSEEEKKDMSARISENSDLLLTIINDILDLTTLETGRYKMKIQETRVNDMCRNALETVMHRKPEHVELKFESDVADGYTVNTDENRVKQVLINFLTNAIKNTDSGEIRLSVNTKNSPGRLQMSVTDTGIGIPADKMDEIFERFKKLDSFKQGTGLGLSICQAIAERLDGRVFIDKEYRNGARFIFEIGL